MNGRYKHSEVHPTETVTKLIPEVAKLHLYNLSDLGTMRITLHEHSQK